MSKSWKRIEMSDYARLSVNPLRKLNFDQSIAPNPEKDVITLQLGDPTIFGNFPPAKEVLEAIKESVDSDSFRYNPGAGRIEAREALAEYYGGGISPDDIVLASGCNHALEMCILTLVAPGENILIPRPCYSYCPITKGTHVVSKSYNLDPNKGWDIDLKHMESLIDERTKAILINNPGNPCGNAFSREHIEDILEIAERHQLPIIADEIYGFMVFPGVKFHSFASVTKNVPVLVCGGLTKRFLMPGIRMGWVVIHDRQGALADVKIGIRNITGRILGPNSTVQLALPKILRNTPKAFFSETMETIARHAKISYDLLKRIPGLKPIMPKGAMYIMVEIEMKKFPEFATCLEFSSRLIVEQSIRVFPGVPCFNFPGFFRIVLTVPEHLIVEACERILEFCETHYQL